MNEQQPINAAATFCARLIPLMMGGMTFEEAGKATLARDKALCDAALAETDEGQAIRVAMAQDVYDAVRAHNRRAMGDFRSGWRNGATDTPRILKILEQRGRENAR